MSTDFVSNDQFYLSSVYTNGNWRNWGVSFSLRTFFWIWTVWIWKQKWAKIHLSPRFSFILTTHNDEVLSKKSPQALSDVVPTTYKHESGSRLSFYNFRCVTQKLQRWHLSRSCVPIFFDGILCSHLVLTLRLLK